MPEEKKKRSGLFLLVAILLIVIFLAGVTLYYRSTIGSPELTPITAKKEAMVKKRPKNLLPRKQVEKKPAKSALCTEGYEACVSARINRLMSEGSGELVELGLLTEDDINEEARNACSEVCK